MPDHNIQMKKRTGSIWDKLFPITKTKLVLDQLRGTTLDKVLTNIYERIAKVENAQSIINVRDFGAVGDGVTDDTKAIQSAIDSIKERNATIVFPPTNDGHYSITQLTIPEKAIVATFIGIGHTRIHFTSRIGFKIQAEGQTFKNLIIQHKGEDHTGIRIFNDERENTRLDFDFEADECDFGYADKVVSTWGRGVVFKNCGFNDITGHFIYLTVKLESEISVGGYDIQKYKTGYRGYILENCRFHYCNTAWIMESVNDFSNVVQGISMVGNQIEGGIGYYKGFARNFQFKDNIHYQADTQKEALFEFNGFKDVDIEVKISGFQSNNDGYVKRIRRLLVSYEGGENLTIKGSLRGIKKHVVTLYKGSTNIDIDLMVTDVVGDEYTPSLLSLGGTFTYDGIIVKGLFLSSSEFTVGVSSSKEHVVYNYNDDNFIIRGTFESKSNIEKI